MATVQSPRQLPSDQPQNPDQPREEDDHVSGLDERRPSLPGIKDLFRDNPNVLTQNSSPSQTHAKINASGVPSVPGGSPSAPHPQFASHPQQSSEHHTFNHAPPPTDLFDTYSMASGRSSRLDSIASSTSSFSSVPDPLDFHDRRRSSFGANYWDANPAYGAGTGPYAAGGFEKPRPPSRDYALSTERGSISEEAGGDTHMIRPETENSPVGGRTFSSSPYEGYPSAQYYYQRPAHPFAAAPVPAYNPAEPAFSGANATTPTRSTHQLPQPEEELMHQAMPRQSGPTHHYAPPEPHPASLASQAPPHHPAYSRPPAFAQLGPPASIYHPPPPTAPHYAHQYPEDPWGPRPSSMGGGILPPPSGTMGPPLPTHSAYMAASGGGARSMYASPVNRAPLRASVPNTGFVPPPGANMAESMRRASESDAQHYWGHDNRPSTAGSASGTAAGSSVEHGRELKHHCPFCQKAFNRPSSLRIHVYSHTGERPYVCKWKGCGRAFSVQSNLKRHNKVHTGSNGAPNLHNHSDEDGQGDDGPGGQSEDDTSRPSTSTSGAYRNAASGSPYAKSSSSLFQPK